MATPFLIGCGEWGFRDLPMAEHCRICRRLGLRVMEFGIGGGRTGRLPERPGRSEIRAFHALLAEHGVDAPYCCLENDFTLPDAAEHRRMVERTLRGMADAARCGATHVRLFAGFTPWDRFTEPAWRRMLDAFDECQGRAEALGLVIAIETHGAIRQVDGAAVHVHTATTHADGLRRLARQLPAGIRFNWDPGNCKAADPDDRSCKLDLLHGRIGYVHLKDWVPQGAGWRAAAPGDGDLAYGELLPRLAFAGPLLIEYEPTADVEDGIRRGLAYLISLGGRIAEPGHD